MTETTQFLINHGLPLVFAAVLVEQMGLPLPAWPWLLAATRRQKISRMPHFHYAEKEWQRKEHGIGLFQSEEVNHNADGQHFRSDRKQTLTMVMNTNTTKRLLAKPSAVRSISEISLKHDFAWRWKGLRVNPRMGPVPLQNFASAVGDRSLVGLTCKSGRPTAMLRVSPGLPNTSGNSARLAKTSRHGSTPLNSTTTPALEEKPKSRAHRDSAEQRKNKNDNGQKLAGKVAVVIGGSRGIGAAIAKLLKDNVALTLEARYLHLSCGISSPNLGLNGLTGMLVLTFFLMSSIQ